MDLGKVTDRALLRVSQVDFVAKNRLAMTSLKTRINVAERNECVIDRL